MKSIPGWTIAMWLATALYVIVLSAESVYRHYTFRSTFDLAVYDQRLWLLSRGSEPFSTIVSKPFLGDHFEPGLALLTPLYWLGLGIPGILVAQTIALALTAPALYALARTAGAAPPTASIPAFLWLASAAVASVNLFDFRPASFFAVLLVLSVLAALQDRYWLLAFSTILAFSLKEDVPVTYFVLGVLLILHGRRRVGVILASGSAACFVVASLVIQSQSDQLAWQARRFAGDRGESMPEVLGYVVQHPVETLGDAFGSSGLLLALLFLSAGGLALLAPSWMLLAAPAVAFNVLSDYGPQHSFAYHYQLPVLAGTYVAAAVGVARLSALARLGRTLVVVGLMAAVAVAVVGGLAAHHPVSPLSPDGRAEIRRALARIPSDAPVAAAPGLLPHLSQRVEVYTFPEPFVQLDWGSRITPQELQERAERVRYVALAGENGPIEYPGAVRDVRALLLAGGWRIVARAGLVEVLHRGAEP